MFALVDQGLVVMDHTWVHPMYGPLGRSPTRAFGDPHTITVEEQRAGKIEMYNAQYNKEDDEWFKPWGTEQRVAVGILDEITKEDFTVFEKRFGTWQFANFKQE